MSKYRVSRDLLVILLYSLVATSRAFANVFYRTPNKFSEKARKKYLRMKYIILLLVLVSIFNRGLAIWCYQCTAATPGCSYPFNWRGVGYLGNPCPDNDDICVKLIERKGAEEVITRDCLSNFKAFRTDIPADTYEGCRKAAKDVNLANYVNNTIKELDVKRDWYDETLWCFCFLDHRCNGASVTSTSMALPILFSAVLLLAKVQLF